MSDEGRTRAQLTSELRQLRQQHKQLKISKWKTQQKMYQAQQKIESLKQSTSETAHDFKNILTVIRCYTELLLEYIPPDDPLHAHLKKIEQSIDQGTSLTQHFLDLGRKQVHQPIMVDLNALIADMEEMLQFLIGHKIKLITALGSFRALVRIDKKQIEQVIINLVVNARDAMPHGGRLSIETAKVEKDKEIMGHNTRDHQGSFVRLMVGDTGIGMDRQTQARIFEPFFTTKTSGSGTGLGLAQIHSIVTQYDGHIEVASQVGSGTTFALYLPSLLQMPATAPHIIPEQNTPKIFIKSHQSCPA